MSEMIQTHGPEQNNVDSEPMSSTGHHRTDCDEMWSALPDEILVRIFKCLQLKDRFQVRAVNKQWNQCALLVVNELKMKLELNRTHNKIIQLKQRDHFQTKEVPLAKAARLLSRFEQTIVENLFVTLWDDCFTEDILHRVAKMAEKTTKFYLKYIFGRTNEYFGVICDAIGDYVTHLECINLGLRSIPCSKEFIGGFLSLNHVRVIKSSDVYQLFPVLIQHSNDIFVCLEEVSSIINDRVDATTRRELWNQFASIYHKRIKRISVSIHNFNYSFIDEFVHFQHLQELTVEYFNCDSLPDLSRFACSLRGMAKTCHRLTSFHLILKLDMSIHINKAEIQAEVENVVEAIGRYGKLSVFSFHFDVLQVQIRDAFGIYREYRLPFKSRIDLPLFRRLHNCGAIKSFKGSSETVFEDERVSWNTWASFNQSMHFIEEVTIECWPSDLKHFHHLNSLKHICIWEPSEMQKPFPEEEIANLVDTCPSLVSVKFGIKLEPTQILFESLARAARRQIPMHRIFTAALLESDATKKWSKKYSEVLPPNMCLKLITFTEKESSKMI